MVDRRLTAMVDRFMSMLDCVDVGFLPEGILGRSAARPPARTLAGRRNPDRRHRHEHTRVRAALAAALASAVARSREQSGALSLV
jgi:hypothetical protein